MDNSELSREQKNLIKIQGILDKKINRYLSYKNEIYIVDNDDRIEWLKEEQTINLFREQARELKEIRNDPYFGSINCEIIEYDKKEEITEDTFYIGKKGLVEDGEQLIVDWRSPFGQYYYKNKYNYRYNNSSSDIYNVEHIIHLKRNYVIKNSKLVKYTDIYNDGNVIIDENINDSILKEIISQQRKDYRLTDIIKTIQENQNLIITAPLNKEFIVQGCAGSGKTMVLLHRLSYLLFNNELDINKIKIITPNENFNMFVNELANELSLNKIKKMSLIEYYIFILSKYNIQLKKVEIENEDNVDSQFLNYIYSTSFYDQIIKFHEKYFIEILEQIKKSSNELNDDEQFNFLINLSKLSDIFKMKIQFENAIESSKKIHDSLIRQKNKLQAILRENNFNNTLTDEVLEEMYKIIFVEYDMWKKEKSLISKYEEEYGLLKKQKINDQNKKNAKILKWHNKDRKILENKIEIIIEKIKNLKNKKNLNKLFLKSQLNRVSKKYEFKVSIYNEYIKNLNNELLKIENECNLKIKNSNDIIKMFETKFSQLFGFDIQSINHENLISNIRYYCEIIIETKKKQLPKNILNSYIEIVAIISKINSIDFYRKYILKWLKSNYPNIINERLVNYKFYYYIILICSYLCYGCVENSDMYIHVDEGQDLSSLEYSLIKKVNKDVILNVYGDIKQNINNYGIINWNDVMSIKNVYFLEENYRNSYQINQFCNYYFNSNIQTFGLDRTEVTSIELHDVIEKLNGNNPGRTALILSKNNTKFIEKLEMFGVARANLNKKSFYTVSEAKGLEFETVIVITHHMTENEKYIAFTRALDKLYICGDDTEMKAIKYLNEHGAEYNKNMEKIISEKKRKYIEQKKEERQKERLKIEQLNKKRIELKAKEKSEREKLEKQIISMKEKFDLWRVQDTSYTYSDLEKVKIGDVVFHNNFGLGLVISQTESKLVIYFSPNVEKTIVKNEKYLVKVKGKTFK